MTLRILVLTGPTACGKTSVGVDAAHAIGSAILSADSRQVYRGLDIGTGKDLDEYRRPDPAVPFHMIDVADVSDIYSIYHYQLDCYALFNALVTQAPFDDGRPLLMVGGSGLYIEAVLRGYRIANVPEDVELRRELMQRPHDELVADLRRADAGLFGETDLSSSKRVVRALEIAAHARSEPVRFSGSSPVPLEYQVFAIEIERETLRRRIAARLALRVRDGLIEEVEGLLADGVPAARLEQLGLEYREVGAFLAGTKDREQMLDDLRLGIGRLAKRQRTWFRGMARRGIDVRWIRPGDPAPLLDHPWAGTGGRGSA